MLIFIGSELFFQMDEQVHRVGWDGLFDFELILFICLGPWLALNSHGSIGFWPCGPLGSKLTWFFWP